MNSPAVPFHVPADVAATGYTSVLFIDAGVPDAAQLVAGAAPGVRVFLLDAGSDGVLQIADALRGLENLESIQIVSHGATGQVTLGSGVLSSASLAEYQDALAQWGQALAPGGDMLLYGCDVGRGSAGLAFVDGLAEATGADVAASTDVTGSAALGGNWTLERHTGTIEAASDISLAAEQAYDHTLGLVNGGAAGTFTFGTASTITLLNATGLSAGAVVHTDNILGLGLDVYAQSTLGGAITVADVPGTSVLGVPVTDARLTVNGSLLSPAAYVDLRANSGVFDLLSLKLGSGNIVGNLLGTTVFTVYALDGNYQPTGVGVSLLSLVVNEYGLLNFDSMANFKGIYGIRIVNPLGFEVGIDDMVVANGRIAPSISSAGYNAGTGVLSVAGLGLTTGDSIDPTKLTLTGEGGGTYTLTTPTATVGGATAFTVTLNAADKIAVNGLLDKGGLLSVGGTSFSLAAASYWNNTAAADTGINAVTVSNVVLPTIASATYDAVSHVLTVSGSNLVGTLGALNDIITNKLTLTGEGGVARTLSVSGNVEISSASSFSVTLTGADATAVNAILAKNGGVSASGTAYSLSAGDDWNGIIGGVNTAVASAAVTVSNAQNFAPTLSGAATAALTDKATVSPFAGVSVYDVNGDNVSVSITYAAANGTLAGTGLSGSAGSYTLSAASAALLTARLDALVFTPTANQVAPGATVATTFTLTATDSNGLAGASNNATVVTTTSVNDAPVVSGTVAAQGVLAGATLHPFATIAVVDPDVGASVSASVVLDSAAKGVFTAASLSASGFSTSDGGLTYIHAAASPAALQAALQALVYQPVGGQNLTTSFTVNLNDGAATSSNSTTTVVALTSPVTTVSGVHFSADSGISSTDLVTNVAAQTVSGTLSANLVSGEHVEVSLNNGATWSTATASVGSNAWTLAGQTLTGSDTLQVRVANAAGSGTALAAAYVYDTTAPTTTGGSVAFSADSGSSSSDLVTNVISQNISGALSANLAAGEHVEVSLDNGAHWSTAAATVGANTWALAGQTLLASNTLQVRVVDAAGNAGAAQSQPYVIDLLGPIMAISSNLSVLKNGETATYTFTFSETPAGFDLGDISATNGTFSNLVQTADPHVYTAQFTPTGGLLGAIGLVSVNAGSYTDIAGNAGGGALALGITLNTLGPSVVITSDTAALKSGETAHITFTFSANTNDFTAADINVSGGTLSGFAATANANVYTAVFTPTTGINNGSASITVTSGSYTDASTHNSGGAGASPLIAIDTAPPSLAITSNLPAVHTGDVATITFTFSEVPLGFDASDVSVTGGTLSGLLVTANPLVYTAQFTPAAGQASGNASISVASGSYTDLAGNAGLAAPTPSISIDTLPPSITGASALFSADTGTSATDLVTRTAPQTITGTLTGSLGVGDHVEVSLDNGAHWSTATAVAGGTTFSLAGQTLTGSNTLQVRVSDAVGNHGAAYSAAYVLDTTAPTLAITSDTGALINGQAATITFTFSEAPQGFTSGDIVAGGGVISGLAATSNPLVWTAVFTPTPGASGISGTVSVPAASYTDVAGNGGAAATMAPLAVNTLLPTLAITSDLSVLKAGEVAHLSFTFNEVPVGFAIGDISVAGGTLSGFAASANPLVYTAVFTPTAGINGGSASISVLAGTYADAAGNNGAAASAPSISIDTQAPTLAISSDSAALKAGETAHITFTFSEAPSGFTQSDVQVSGGTLSAFAVSPSDSHVYTALFTPTPNTNGGVADIRVAAGAYTDAAGNTGGAGAPPTLVYDTHIPVTTNTAVAFSADNGSSNSDLLTDTSVQTVSGTLSASLVAGELVEVSLDNGLTWVAASGTVGSTAWSLANQTLVGSDTLQVRVSDTAGNHGAAFSAAYVLDLVPPTVAITSDAASLNGAQTAQITFTFSEAPVGFTLADIGATGGSMSGLTQTANPLVWTATLTPDAGNAGSVASVTVAGGSYTDNAGNAGVAGAAPAIAVDTQAPLTTGGTVQFSNDSGPSGTDLVTNVALQDISGTLTGNLAPGEQVEVSLDNGAHWQFASATAGSAAWSLAGQTLSGSGTLLVRVDDAAGNHGLAAATQYAIDTAAPTLAMSSSMNHLNSADRALITFTFSEAPQDFTAGDISVSGGTLTGFTATANPNVYTALFTPTAGVANGSASIGVAAGGYTDLAGNAGAGASPLALSYQTVAPGVAISSNVATLKDGESATISFTFSSAPSGFDATDIVASNGVLSGFGATADPLVFTAQFTPNAGIASANAGISIAAGTYTDALSNAGTGATAPAIHIDTVAPTLLIDSNLASLKAGDTATITFTFSEAPVGFAAADVSATGGTLSNLAATANPLVWTATLTPAAGVANGSAGISVAAGAYTDAVGNGGVAGASPTLAVHTLAPTTTGATVVFSADNGASGSDLVTNVALQNISGTLSANLGAGEVVEVSLDNGAHWLTAAAVPGGSGWLLAGQTLTASNTLQVRVTDAAGNHGAPSSSDYVLDTTAPTVHIDSNAASLKAGETAAITFTFSEAPVNFDASDLVVTGGALSGLSASADPLVWHAVLTPTDGINGSAAVSLAPGLYTDTAGNLGGGAASAGIAVHTLAPGMVITSDLSTVKAGDTALITFTFSQAPIGFTASDVSASGGTLSGFATTSNPRVYTAHFTPGAGLDGVGASISVGAGTYTDATGNSGAAASLASLLVDTVAPLTAIATAAFSADHGASGTDLVTDTAVQTISGTLGATLVAGETVEVSLDNGAHWTAATATAGSAGWSLGGQTLAGSDILQVRVSDAAGNHGPAFSHAYVLDTTAPTLAVTSNATTLNGGQSATLTFTFSEAPSGFASGDISATGGSIGPLTQGANPLVYTALFTPTPGFSGNAGVSVAAGSYTDIAGNAGAAAASAVIGLDAIAPTLLISSSSAALKTGEAATLTFTFSEAPTGFTAGDIAVSNGTLSGFAASANPLVYTATFTPSAGLNGVLAGIGVAAGAYTDAAGNPGVAGASPVISIDTQAPTLLAGAVAFSADNGSSGTDLVTNVAAQTISGTLSGLLPAGELVEVSLDNGAHWTTAVSAAGANSWSLAGQTLSGSGALQVRVSDSAGNHGAVFSTPYAIDTTAPTMTMSSNASALHAGQAATLTFTFSEAPVGFAASDLVVSNGTLSGFGATANPLVYTALLTPTPGLSSGTAGVTLAAGQYSDLAGNLGAAASSAAIVIDTLAPTLAITSSAASLRAGETATLTFTFSEAPLGFTSGDIAVTGGSIGGLAATANPLVYTAVFTPSAVSGGSASIGVAAGAYTDAAGNGGGAASVASIALNTLAPAQLVTGVHFSNDTGPSNSDLVTSVAAQTISGTLTAALAGSQVVEVSLDNGATWVAATAATGATTFSLAGQTLSASNVLQVRVSDGAGNHGVASHNSYTLDTGAPTVALSSNAASLAIGQTATLTFTFSEAPQGFTLADLVATNGTVSALTATANPLVYTAVFTPAPGLNGANAGVTLASGNFTDLAGNSGGAAAVAAISVDTQAPTTGAVAPSFSADSGGSGGDFITNVAAQTVSGDLSTALLAGETVQVSFDGGLTWSAAAAGAGATHWSVAGLALQGAHTLKIRVSDAAGNAGPTTSVNYVLDTVAPTVAITSSRATLLTAQSATISFTLSDPFALTLADISVAGGTLSNLHHGSGNNYTALFTPAANSTAPASIGIAGHLIVDDAGNANAAASLALTVDTTRPVPPTGPSGPVGTPSTVDGVSVTTTHTDNSHTGLAEQTVAVPTIAPDRVEDGSTQHAALADIPLGIAANSDGIASTLVVSMPVGTGLQASGAATLLSGGQASLDLLGRVADNMPAGAALTDMQQHLRDYLGGLGSGMLLQAKSLVFSGGSSTPILVTGDAADHGSATALVIDTGGLGAQSVLQLDNVGFAAILGAATVHGGAGQNFIVGDDAVQHIVLTAGSDNDTVFGGGGDDVIGSAAGNDHLDGGSGNDIVFGGGGNDAISGGDGDDVLQGGRSDVGQWQFYLNANGQVVGQHQMAMTDATTMETVAAAELNTAVSTLAFAGASAKELQSLSLFYHSAFERAPDLQGLSFWATSGLTLDQVAEGFFATPEAQGSLASLDNADFVQRLYQNSFGRSADAGELAFWQSQLDAAPGSTAARISVFEGIALSGEHQGVWQTSDGVVLGGSNVQQEQGWIANSGDDRLEGGSGNNVLVGGDGTDTAVYADAAASHGLSLSAAGDVSIMGQGGQSDTVRQMELGAFSDGTVDIAFTQAAPATLEQVGMMYHLLLGRAGDIGGFRDWVDSKLGGGDLAAGFLDSTEFVQRFSGLDNTAFIEQIYQNAEQQAAPAADLQHWEAYLSQHSRADTVAAMSTDVQLVGAQMGPQGISLVGSLA